jgi:NADP-dependent 3-hydroxy acid dehydrogenase YdfG
MSKIAFITGATSGIGRSTAKLFAANGYDVIIAGRRAERLEELAAELNEVDVLQLSFDVRNRDEVDAAIKSLEGKWKSIDVLVNNAGLARGLDLIHEGDIEHWETMIDTNIKGLLYVTRQVSPMMVERGSGHIINVGSIAGKEVYLKGNVYAATKHAVDALNMAMRIDLLDKGIKVTGIAPGHVDTEFAPVRFDWDESKSADVYKGFEPLHPDDIADVIYFAASRPKNVNINDLVIMCQAQANTAYINKET